MQKVILFEPAKCTGCRRCVLACSLAKEGVFNPEKARIGVISISEVGMHVPMFCQQCAKPLCADVCPVGAISRSEETGAMVLDPDLCIGCKMCVTVCPLSGCLLSPDARTVMKCDLCGGDPQCVKYCEFGALEFVDADEVAYVKRKAGVEKLAEALKRIG
jgi:carbon-monoxide dehydrogenase iron sulfur subunit